MPPGPAYLARPRKKLRFQNNCEFLIISSVVTHVHAVCVDKGKRYTFKGNRAVGLQTRYSSSHPYDDPVPPAPVMFPPPPKAPQSPSRPPAAGAACFAKNATVLPTVLSDMAPSIGAAAAAAAVVDKGAVTAEAAVTVEAVCPAAPDVAARVLSVGDDARNVLAGFAVLSPLFGFDDVLTLDSETLAPPATAAAPASPRVIALMILMCRFVHGRFS